MLLLVGCSDETNSNMSNLLTESKPDSDTLVPPKNNFTCAPEIVDGRKCYSITSSTFTPEGTLIKSKECPVCLGAKYCELRPDGNPFQYGRCLTVLEFRANEEHTPYWKVVGDIYGMYGGGRSTDIGIIPLGFCFNFKEVKPDKNGDQQ